MPAKMPLAYIEPTPIPVSQLEVGQTGFINFSELRVDLDLSTFIEPATKLRKKSFNTVEVRRNDEGWNVVIHDATLTFRRREITDYADLIPVVEIIEEIEPDFFAQIDAERKRAKDLLDRRGGKVNPSEEGTSTPETTTERPGALMPASRIRPTERLLCDLEMGQTGCVEFMGVSVDEKTGSTYIDKDARLNPEPHGLNVTVTRKGDGYHLTKGYSLTDCISMQTMRREGLTEILTSDRHF